MLFINHLGSNPNADLDRHILVINRNIVTRAYFSNLGVMDSRTTYLTTSDVARFLKVSADSVRLYENKGILRAIRTKSGQRLFRIRDVEDFRNRRRSRTSSVAEEAVSGA